MATQTTDEQGNYFFNGLKPGSYSVQFEAPEGYRFTRADRSGVSDTSTATPTAAPARAPR
ncbi:MAG: hypothetical protein IPG57_24060 [Burkholderiales bacterium]|nr:hypothetical protein [Burkholderiales bacterium]